MGVYSDIKYEFLITNPEFFDSIFYRKWIETGYNIYHGRSVTDEIMQKEINFCKERYMELNLNEKEPYIISGGEIEEKGVGSYGIFLDDFFKSQEYLHDINGIVFRFWLNYEAPGEYYIYKYHNTTEYAFYSVFRLDYDLKHEFNYKVIFKDKLKINFTKLINENHPIEVISHAIPYINNYQTLEKYLEKLNSLLQVKISASEMNDWSERDPIENLFVNDYILAMAEELGKDPYEDLGPIEFISRRDVFQKQQFKELFPFVSYTKDEMDKIKNLISNIHKKEPCTIDCKHIKALSEKISLEYLLDTNDPYIFLISIRNIGDYLKNIVMEKTPYILQDMNITVAGDLDQDNK